MDELDPIFTRLSKDDLLNRCLKGITQNQNEAANGILWSKCPKTKFCGVRRVCVPIAACETITLFNTGAASKAVTLDLCGVTPGVSLRVFEYRNNIFVGLVCWTWPRVATKH